jgi:GR25 family glycosyltransferase involved in LPS biosynthesis
MRDEFRLLFACARARHTETTISTIRRILAGDVDWALIARNAAQHGLAGLVGHSLSQIAPDMVPEDIQDAFRTNLDQTRDANLRATADILELMEVFANGGVCAFPFKGPLFAVQAYKDPGFRLFAEWDFLVRDSEMDQAIRILRGLGYSRKGQFTPGQREILNRVIGRETVIHPETGTSISLRTRLTPLNMAMDPDYTGLWARAQLSTVNQRRITVMTPEDFFQGLALDGATHMWRDVESICDVAMATESRPDLDWTALLEQARAQGCLKSLLLAAALARQLFDANVPAAVASAAERTPSIKFSIGRIAARWERSAAKEPTSDSGLLLDRLRIHDGFGRRVRHTMRTLFLPTPYHISRIAFPGPLNNLLVYGASRFVPHRVINPMSRSIRGAIETATSMRFRSTGKKTRRNGDRAYQCYVITLARLPDKYPAFLASNEKTGLEFRRFEGVDGKALSQADAINTGVIRPSITGYTAGAIGCAASHLQLWKQVRNSQDNILILEDDAYCRWDIRDRLDDFLGDTKDWDIILLGYNTGSILDVRISDDCDLAGFFSNQNPTPTQLAKFQRAKDRVTLMRLNNALGSCAYLLSPRGAEKLINAFPMDNRPVVMPGLQMIKSGQTSFRCITSDMIMNTVYRDIGAYAVVPPLVIPRHDHATSTTHGGML